MKRKISPNKLLIGLFILSPTQLNAQSFIFQGINQIADSGAGQTNASDASAATSNPAGLALISKTASYADISAMAVRYTYAHTNYDPVTIRTNAPPANLGVNINTKRGINLGLMFAPRSVPGAKPMNVDNVPTYTGAGYALFDLKVKQTGMIAALGGAGRVGESPLSIGFSVLYGQDGQEITAYADEGDHTIPGMDTKYEGSSYQGVLGVRYEKESYILGLSFRSASERHYKGDLASTVSDNVYTDYDGVSYQPAMLAAAYESKGSSIGGLIELNREFWSRGRSIANRGLPYASPETDFKDTIGVMMAMRYYGDMSQIYSLSCGYYSANTGDGRPSATPTTTLAESEIPASSGMEFGQMEAIPRYVFGGGFKQRLSNYTGYWMISGNYQTGTRVIPPGHKGEGWYHLDIYTLSTGLTTNF